MREQLIQYVNLLFAGNSGVEDIQQEILQNTLDRYDDLTAQGRTPEEAYRQAISGIGDINEIINGRAVPDYSQDEPREPNYAPIPGFEGTASAVARMMRAVAIFLYIICPVPLFLFDKLGWSEIGVCCLLIIVAIATALLFLFRAPKAQEEKQEYTVRHPSDSSRKQLKKSIGSLISTVGVVFYFIISFATGAWFITWVIFPLIGAVKGVVNACLDLKEE